MRSSDDGNNNADADPVSSSPVNVLHKFSFAEIKTATNDFSNFLAKQVLDTLYSGKISANCYNGDVMVKRLYSNSDFRKERDLLSVCDHVNIISHVGYCDEGFPVFLVYDFKPNGTLHDYLYKHDDQKRLNVEQRLEICIGVAKALTYLHSRNLFHIIKGRLNLRDIFLDDNLVPKMSRFDTSRIIGACKRRGKRIVHTVLQRHGGLIQGKGAFGSVYRGSVSRDWYTGLVAVKRMSIDPEQGIPSFRKEIALLSNCNQVNIILLIGYCDEGDEKILLYEFMPNGSLYDYLYHRKECTPLSVEQRLEICLGVARGLSYLHSRKDYNIIHSDLKTDNILLDANLVPKIADFGLSRTRVVGPSSSEIITNNIQEGYIAPECYEPNYMLSRKADVYAFGVVLLELLCERPAWNRLVIFALPLVLRGELRKFTPKYIKDNISLRCSRACEYIIRNCLDTDPHKRPFMNQVVDELELALKMQNQN